MFRLNKWRLFLFFWIIRLINAFLVSSYIDPDEFWQSLEPAHRLVFGYGYLTWEWRRENAIRSWLFPLLFASGYKLLQSFGLDNNYEWFILVPKFIQSIIAALLDYYTVLLGTKYFGSSSIGTTIFLTLCSWFNAVYGVKTYSNTMETMLFAAAMYYWPLDGYIRGSLNKSLIIAGLSCLIRPSAVTSYLTPSIYLFFTSKYKFKIIASLIPITLLIISFGFLIDSYFYHSPTLSWLNFARINFFQNISSFYGVSQWYYYPILAIPAIALTSLPLCLYGLFKHRFLLSTVIGMILLNTLSLHKEIRFLYPSSPLLIVCASKALHNIGKRRKIIVTILIVTNLLMFLMFGLFNQCGSIIIMKLLKQHNPSSVYFAMPCHSTPFQSHLHLPMTKLRFITCEPPISLYGNKLIHYKDETDIFSMDPVKFIKHANVVEDYVIAYDVLLQTHPNIFDNKANGTFYKEVGRVWNGGCLVGDERRRGDIVLLKRSNK